MTAKKISKIESVAQYFIYLSNRDKKSITNNKLQKLVYYAQAWSLVFNNKKLFNDPIEAWIHGPAVRKLYLQYRNMGFGPIQKDIDEKTIIIDKKDKAILDEVWTIYGKYDAEYLEILSHCEQPWQDTREGLQVYEGSSNEITRESMKQFYSAKLKKIQEEQNVRIR